MVQNLSFIVDLIEQQEDYELRRLTEEQVSKLGEVLSFSLDYY